MMKRSGYISQAWLVLLLALIFGVALAGVQVAWGPRIEQNKEDDARNQIPMLVEGADPNLTPPGEDLVVEDAQGTRVYRVYAAMAKGEDGKARPIGWVVKAKGPGYADNIEVLIGLDRKIETITGLYVLAQNETPGLGNKIGRAKWRKQFRKKRLTGPLVVTKGEPRPRTNEIQAVSGATISSESVCEIVNRAVWDFKRNVEKLRDEQ